MRVNKIDQCQSLCLVSVLLSIVYEITSAFNNKRNKEEFWKDMSRNIIWAPSILIHSWLNHSFDWVCHFFRTPMVFLKLHVNHKYPGSHVTVAEVVKDPCPEVVKDPCRNSQRPLQK